MTTLIVSYIAVLLLSTCLAVLVRKRLSSGQNHNELDAELPTYSEIIDRIESIETAQHEIKDLLKGGVASRDNRHPSERPKHKKTKRELEPQP